MPRFLLGRVLAYAVVLLMALTVNFLLPRIMPGDPVILLLGEDAARLPAETIERALQRVGLDRPLPEQYVRYLANLLRGDLGHSYRWRQPVAALLLARLPWTLLLVGTSIVLSSVLGIAVGTLAAWRRGRPADGASLTLFMMFDAMPSFWLGMILIVLFGVELPVLPFFGATSLTEQLTGLPYLLSVLNHLVLPAATLTLVSAGGMFLITRYAMLDVFGADYIVTARAKGVGRPRLVFAHALRNGLLPVSTALLLRIGHLAGGAVVVETVFSYPGLGRLMYQAVLSRDYPVVQGAFLLFTLTMIAANLLADLSYPLLDPRVRRRDDVP